MLLIHFAASTRYAFARCTHCHETVISMSLMRSLCFNVKSLLPSTDRRKGCSNCCRLPPTINQDHLQGELAVMCVLHCIRAERLTLSCRWWGCTAGYAEWSHPAACLSWCRNLQTCRSVEKRTKRKKGTEVSVFANCLWAGGKVPARVINPVLSLSSATVPGSFQTWGSRAWTPAIPTQ